MKPYFTLFCVLAVAVIATNHGQAQDRDIRAERLVLDDGSSNILILKAPTGPIAGGTLTLPDPAGSAILMTDSPPGLSQNFNGTFRPGSHNVYDLGSGGNKWKNLFLSGDAELDGNGLFGGELRLVETGGGSDYVGFVAPSTVSTNQIWQLPAQDGSSGDVLTTDGSGSLSWTSPGGSSGLTSVGGSEFARKTADETVTSSTTLQNDDHLAIGLNANETYVVEGELYVTSTQANHDLQIAFTVPSGASMKISYAGRESGASGNSESGTDLLTSSGAAGTQVVDLNNSTTFVVGLSGIVRTGSNSGDFQLQWADDQSSGSEDVTVEEDSYLVVTRVE